MKEWLKKSYPYILTALVVCGILSRSILDGYSLNVVEYDDYGRGI
jgi:hypothetical protein